MRRPVPVWRQRQLARRDAAQEAKVTNLLGFEDELPIADPIVGYTYVDDGMVRRIFCATCEPGRPARGFTAGSVFAREHCDGCGKALT